MDRSRAPGNVPLAKGAAGLPRPSVVNISQIVTLDKSGLDQRIGKLPAPALASVLQGLQLLFNSTPASVPGERHI